MEDLHTFLNYIGLLHFILCISLFIFFFLLSLLDRSFSFWSLLIIGIAGAIIVNIINPPWPIFEKVMIYGMFCAGGWVLAAPINFILSLMTVGEAAGKKLRKWADE